MGAFKLNYLKKKISPDWPLHLSGHLYFVGMLVLSLVLYQERMLAMDSAYYTFKLIVHQDFYTGHERTISYIPQLLPLLGMQMGWSLKAVLMAYSAGFILFYYLAFNIIVYLFRNPRAGIFLALALGLTVRYKFYGPVGEVMLSMVPLALLLGWLSKPKAQFQSLPAWLDLGIGIGIASLLLTAHPFIAISAMVSLGFLLIYQKEWRNPQFWLTSLFTMALLLYQFVLSGRNAYESQRTDRLGDALQVFSNYHDYYIFEAVYRYFDTQYAFPFALFLLAILLLLSLRRWGVAIYLLFSFSAVLAITIVLHAYLASDIFIMLDGYLAHVGLIWALPLAFHWGTEKRRWMVLAIASVLLFSLVRIENTKHFFQERLTYLKTALANQTSAKHPKGAAYQEDLNFEKMWIGWAMGCETLLLSALDGPQNSRTIYLADKRGDLDGRFNEPDLFLCVPFGPDMIKYDDLPKQYFLLPRLPYREVTLE